jgi:hypothetical protein
MRNIVAVVIVSCIEDALFVSDLYSLASIDPISLCLGSEVERLSSDGIFEPALSMAYVPSHGRKTSKRLRRPRGRNETTRRPQTQKFRVAFLGLMVQFGLI